MRLPVAAALSILLAPMLDASRPLEWKAINYAPRGHAYFRMLYDWFTTDAATGLQVRQLADADLAMLHRSGFNAVHLYLWDQPTFADFYRKGTTRRLEKAGFSFPDPALSERRQWEALDEFVALAESHEIWVIPHFVHTPFNERLDSLSRAQVERRSEQIAGWAGAFISYLSPRHRNILAWGALYALEPAPDDDPAHPNPYSLLWRLLYANLKRRIHSVSSEGEVPPLFTYLYFPSRGKDISGASEVAPGVLEGYSLDAGIAKRRFQSMRRQLSYELGRETEPDLVYTYLFGPDTPAIERSLRELTGGNDAVPADRSLSPSTESPRHSAPMIRRPWRSGRMGRPPPICRARPCGCGSVCACFAPSVLARAPIGRSTTQPVSGHRRHGRCPGRKSP